MIFLLSSRLYSPTLLCFFYQMQYFVIYLSKYRIFASYNPESRSCEIAYADLDIRFRPLSFDGIRPVVIRCCEFASNFAERSSDITSNGKVAE